MKMDISTLERDTLLSWRGTSKAILPEEDILATTLKNHQGGSIDISDTQIIILTSWAESTVDHNFGSGAITNITENILLSKIKERYSKLSSSNDFSLQEKPFIESSLQNNNSDNRNIQASRAGIFLKIILIGIALIIAIVILRVYSRKPFTSAQSFQTANEPYLLNVSYIIGDVLFKRDGSWKKLKIGMQVTEYDSIQTLKASKVTLSNINKSFTMQECMILRVKDLK